MNRIEIVMPTLDETRSAYARAEQFVPMFPNNGCAAALSAILHRRHIEDNAQALADQLERDGWVRIPKEAIPLPGDVMVSEDLNGNGMADHVALVCTGVKGRYLCWDNQLWWPIRHHLPYWRNIFKEVDGKTPVAYWLRNPNNGIQI
jgi:hypothetical protein